MPENEISRLLDVDGTDHDAVAQKAIEYGISSGNAAHPSLATHDAMGLSTDAELTDHIVDAPDPHPIYALDVDLDAHVHTGTYEPAGTVATHAAAGDPHAGYLKESDFQQLDLLVGTATGLTANEIAVGTSPGGELGGTWASPTVDSSHAGGTHAATQAAAEATAAGALSSHAAAADPHAGYLREAGTIDFLVGSSQADLSSEIVVGTTPGGELGNTWASPTVDASHSGSTHAATQAAAEATAAAANTADIATHAGLADPHTGYRLESASHDHSTSGLPGGTVAHSVLTGQTATDHHAAPAAGPDADATVDAAGAAGTASTFARSGHGHKVTTDSGVASTQAFGDAASAGTSGTIQRAGHKHAMPADPTTAHVAAGDPHTQYALDTDLVTHAALPENNVQALDLGTFTIATAASLRQPTRLTLTTTERMSGGGTGRASLTDEASDPSVLRYRNPGSVTLMPDEYTLEVGRIAFYGNARKTEVGNARTILTDLQPGGRLVLAGRGG